jgi:RNA polymerase sigma factor (sigma-70 family)
MNDSIARGFCVDFKKHEALIHKFARKGYGRLMEMNVVIDYEDVFQEMCLAYTKATSKYDASKGITFSAYMGRVIWNEFNKFVEREQLENYVSLDGFGSEDEGDEADIYEAIPGNYTTPEEFLERKQETRWKNKQCSPTARFLLKQFINPTPEVEEQFEAQERKLFRDITISFIAKCNKGLDPNEVKAARKQIEHLYGVQCR